jgi:hypothetical protein
LKAGKPNPRLYLNSERTVLVRVWGDGTVVTISTREHPDGLWGIEVDLFEEPPASTSTEEHQ